MQNDAGDLIVSTNRYVNKHSHVYIIENSDHHLYFDNPKDFADAIIKDLSNLHELD